MKTVMIASLIILSCATFPQEVAAYPLHNEINIYDNSGFNSTNGVVSGNGSAADPFVIEGWEIWGGIAAISIINTNASFIIRNVSLYGDSSIRIVNATNGMITHIETHPTSQSILLDRASNITITRTTLAYGGFSVYMTDSLNCSINNSTLIESFSMLIILNSRNISISNNYFGSNSRNMVVRFSSITVQNNDFGPSSIVDVQLENDNGSSFRNNTVLSYGGHGFSILDSVNTIIEGNQFSDVDLSYNIPYGIGILIVNSSNIKGFNNEIIQRTYAIKEVDSQYCKYNDNSIERSTTGLFSVNSSGMSTSTNNMMTTGPSIVLQGTTDSNLSNDTLTGGNSAIQLIQTSQIQFDGAILNTTSITGKAIDISYSSHIEIENTSAKWSSIAISMSESDNVSVRNGDFLAITGAAVSHCADVLFDSNKMSSTTTFLTYGLAIINSKGVSIVGNDISGAEYDVYASATSKVRIEGNRFWNQNLSGAYGLLVESSESLIMNINSSTDYLIIDNIFTGQESAIALQSSGNDISSWCSNFIISSNYFRYTSVRLGRSLDMIVEGNIFDSGSSIMLSSYNPGMKVSGNTFLNWSGLVLSDAAHGITIEKNTFSFCGIAIWGNSINDFTGNVIKSDNTLAGKPIYFIANATSVNISDVPVGQLMVVNAGSVNISKVNIASTCDAILLAYVKNAVIQRSNIISNEIGIKLVSVDSTLIHHNNFINNIVHISATPTPSDITYYLAYPFGGNFWSNYNGSDIKSGVNQNLSGGDGFFDSPYIGPNVTDAYPLAVPYTNMRPIAIIQISPAIGDLSTIFQFDASGSIDLEDPGFLLQVRWDFNGDGIWDTDWSTNKTVDHQYAAPGQYELHFQVRDTNGGMSNFTSSVVVGDGGFSPSILPIVLVTVTVALSLMGLGYSLMKVRQSSLRNANREDHQNVQNIDQGDPSGGNGPHIIKGSRGGGVKP